ncbi:MAG: cytochrome b/b6 domain-containing protein [Rhodobacteraceae bacterium]|nr:cytochrome b/b6 domain-containing protein [Paracoccaceae bacterium]
MSAPAAPGPEVPEGGPPALWDPIVRLTHWGIAAAVLLNATVTAESDTLHLWIGYVAGALLVLRLVWGLVGPPEARFGAFPPSPRRALAHLADLLGGRPKAYPSHNPAGALMVYALWATLAVLVLTGIALAPDGPGGTADRNAAFGRGEWSVVLEGGARLGERDEEMVEDVHETAANLLLILAALHVAGVVVESRGMRRNLLRPMLLGARGRAR